MIQFQSSFDAAWQFTRRIYRTIRGERRSVAVFLLLSLALAATESIGLALLVPVLDLGQHNPSFARIPLVGDLMALIEPYPVREKLRIVGVLLLVALAVRATIVFATNHMSTSVPSRIFRRLSVRAFDALLQAEMRLSDSKSSGELYTLVVSAPERAVKVIKGVAQILVMAPLVVVIVALMLLVSWKITLFAVSVFLVLSVVVRGVFMARSRQLGSAFSLAEIGLSHSAYESFRLLLQTKLFGTRKHTLADFDGRLAEYTRCRIAQNRIASAVSPLMTIGSGFAVVIILIALSYGTADPASQVAELLLLVAAMSRLPGPIAAISAAWLQIINNLDGFDRMDHFLREAQAHAEPKGSTDIPHFSRIVFDGVKLTYPGRNAPAVAGVSFEIRRGELVALVGPSGSGKTTLVNLLARIYDPDAGAIRLDDVDLRTIAAAAWRQQIGFVSQDVTLLDGSITENIAFNREGIGAAEVRRAAEMATAQQFIEALPNGYDTPVGANGKALSGGQKQRIAIARALAGGSGIIILDEATSSLDPTSEHEVRACVANLARSGITVVTITHRLQTIHDADTIVVIDGGRAVDKGTDEDLMGRCDVYRTLRLKAMQENKENGMGLVG